MIAAHEVEHLAKLARICVSEKELPALVEEFDGILDYVGQLNELTLSVEKPISMPILHNVFREDGEPTPAGANTDTIVSAFPQARGNALSVKKIL